MMSLIDAVVRKGGPAAGAWTVAGVLLHAATMNTVTDSARSQ
jgi:hypothetical protein